MITLVLYVLARLRMAHCAINAGSNAREAAPECPGVIIEGLTSCDNIQNVHAQRDYEGAAPVSQGPKD